MRIRSSPVAVGRRALFAAVGAVAFAATAAHAQYRIPAPPPARRIDPLLLVRADTAATLDVFILGRTQLFAPVGGLDEFAAKHADADRRELRKTVIRDLKRIADDEQPAILKVLASRTGSRAGGASAPRRFWIVNAVAATVTPAELRTLAALDEVRFIYPSSPPIVGDGGPRGSARAVDTATIPGEDGSKVRAVLSRVARAPFDTSGKTIPWNVRMLRAPEVWRQGIAGEGIVVASLDNGVNYLHPDLRNNIWINPGEIANNGKDDDGNGYVDDLYGFDFARMGAEVGSFLAGPRGVQHGTMTSGIVAGDGTEGIVTGVAPRARIMALKGNSIALAPLAFEYALMNGADVVNMSFSIADLGNARGVWRLLADQATAAGLVLGGGAGNFRQTQPLPVQIQSPKDIPSVIAAGGVDSTLQLTQFSSMGPAEWSGVELYRDYPLPEGIVKPDVVAFPGWDYPVLAYPAGYVNPNRTYRGNSFSGPQVAGVAALMLSAAPSLPAWRVGAILRETARDLGPPGKDNQFGAGLMDALRAVERARAERPRR